MLNYNRTFTTLKLTRYHFMTNFTLCIYFRVTLYFITLYAAPWHCCINFMSQLYGSRKVWQICAIPMQTVPLCHYWVEGKRSGESDSDQLPVPNNGQTVPTMSCAYRWDRAQYLALCLTETTLTQKKFKLYNVKLPPLHTMKAYGGRKV
jgi:hypothetical protein